MVHPKVIENAMDIGAAVQKGHSNININIILHKCISEETEVSKEECSKKFSDGNPLDAKANRITEDQVFHIPRKNGQVYIVRVNQDGDGEKGTTDGHLQLQTPGMHYTVKQSYTDNIIVEAQETQAIAHR